MARKKKEAAAPAPPKAKRVRTFSPAKDYRVTFSNGLARMMTGAYLAEHGTPAGCVRIAAV